jgi:hypothetical protein
MWWFFFSTRPGYFQNRSTMGYKGYRSLLPIFRINWSSKSNGKEFSVIRNNVRGDYPKSIRFHWGSFSRKILMYGNKRG